MTPCLALLFIVLSLLSVVQVGAFVLLHPTAGCAVSSRLSMFELFEDEEEMIPIVQNYVHARYKESARAHGHEFCTAEDAKEVLRNVLPPVTPGELAEEVTKTLEIIMKNNPNNSEEKIDEDDFVKAIVKNSYWQEAGDLVVKELMYFDALHHYYTTGYSLLNDNDYNVLKDNLTWEGSSVATMKAQEANFVTAVAASRRGEPIMEDGEYQSLKRNLKQEGSWVVSREQDALEKLGLNTFMGYLHRAL